MTVEPIQQDPLIDQKISSYRVLRKIGEGGMGSVYEAVHTELGRRAAIKILRGRSRLDPTQQARFFLEAKAISMVSHPCLVTIYEHGTYTSASTPASSEEGLGYIIMEFIAGESLRTRLQQQYLGSSSLNLLRQLASALTLTHKQRIIHRDLKPENIMLIPDDTVAGGVRAKLLDFGLAKLLPQPEESSSEALGAATSPANGAKAAPAGGPAQPAALGQGGFAPQSVKTRTGVVLGTPMYMSPEQCGGTKPAEERSDVYALGIIAYELFYGEPPFVSDSVGELYAMHLFFPVPDLAKRVPSLQPQLAALVHRMLEKKIDARPSMEQVLAELQGLPSTGLSDGDGALRPSSSASGQGPTRDDSGPGFLLKRLAEPSRERAPVAQTAEVQLGAASRAQAQAQAGSPRRRSLQWLTLSFLLACLGLAGFFWAARPGSRDQMPPPELTVRPPEQGPAPSPSPASPGAAVPPAPAAAPSTGSAPPTASAPTPPDPTSPGKSTKIRAKTGKSPPKAAVTSRPSETRAPAHSPEALGSKESLSRKESPNTKGHYKMKLWK
ncbi:MAG: serine/threonine protein kinase [Myxococcales bacterium]|nr:serine/threonine protein kinase [Myxococcales bacterium]